MKMIPAGPIHISDACRIWLFGFPRASEKMRSDADDADGVGILNSCDRGRYFRYRSLSKRRQFLNSRHAIQFLLSQDESLRHLNLGFATSENGRPQLVDASGVSSIGISLSHSGGVVAIAITDRNTLVGIDVEENQEPIQLNAVATALGYAEPLPLQHALHDTITREQFLRMAWTCYEATWKAMADTEQSGFTGFQTARWYDSDITAPTTVNSTAELIQKRCFAVNCFSAIRNSVTMNVPALEEFAFFCTVAERVSGAETEKSAEASESVWLSAGIHQ